MAAKSQGFWQLLQLTQAGLYDLLMEDSVQRGDGRLAPEAGKVIINLQVGLPQLSRFWNTLPLPRGSATDVSLCLEPRI